MKNIPFFESYDSVKKMLTLRGATYFPEEIFDFVDEIEILDMSHGELSSLPSDFPKLNKLRIAFFSNNPFEEIPEVLANCPNLSMLGFKACKISVFAENSLPVGLRWLILTDNLLTELPASMGKVTKLQKLSLTGNRLKSLPTEMTACKNLELIRLGANSFDDPPPSWLFDLPHLAWYGDNGNPFNNKHVVLKQPKIPEVSWEEIEFRNAIGKSPSSTVFKGIFKKNQQEIAVKVYKGELTSDGFPIDDMRSALIAGNHKNLIKILGRLMPGGPNQREGLVLELVPSDYKSLGLPPNFNTIARDTFAKNTSFSLPYILKVLKDVSSAAKHLHKKGVMHGDLYAHNILTNDVGNSLLGDFGAASLYQPSENKLREKIDIRAFGYLIDDLFNYCEKKEGDVFEKLMKLKTSCLEENIVKRPLFDEIYQILT